MEDITVVPRNNPGPTVDRINRKYRRGGSEGNSTTIVNLHISGNDIINERNLSKRIKTTVGENRDKFG
jgi:hypothetical protein